MSFNYRRTAALLAIVTGISLASASQESKPTVRHHRVEEIIPAQSDSPEVDQAETAIQHRDFATAEPLLQKAAAAKPNDYRAWFDLGYVYNATNRPAGAIEAYRKAVAAKPDVFESNLNLGILLARQGNNAEAAPYLKNATQLKPTADPEEGLARAWQSLGHVEEVTDPQQAFAAYAEAARLKPIDPEPHLSAAILYEKQNNLAAAEKEFQAAYGLDPKSHDATAGLANIYTRQKKYPQAESMLRKLLETDPKNAAARVQLGRILAEQGKNEEAAAEIQKASQPSKTDPQAALELGTLYVKANKDTEAEEQFRLAVREMPQNAEVHYALGSLLMHIRKFPEAEQELLAAIKLKPDLAEAYGNLAVVAAENQNYQLAIQALDSRGKFLPESPTSYFLRATSFDHLKAVPQAVEYYQRFLAADGGKLPDQEWQARHRLIALDPKHANNYRKKQ